MEYPENFLKNASRILTRETFPYNVINIFNLEPPYVRNSLGKKSFKYTLKDDINLRCQHRVTNNLGMTCKACEMGGIKSNLAFGNYKPSIEKRCQKCDGIFAKTEVRIHNILKFDG